MRCLRWFRGKERGVTLIELMVAIPIAGLLAVAAGVTIVQLLHTNNISADMLAVRQVENAGDWVSRDSVQAQSITGVASDNVSSGLPFTLTWVRWDTGASPPVNETHQVKYWLKDVPGSLLKQLQRTEVVTNASGAVTSNTTTTVAEYIDGSATTCRWLWVTTPAPGYSTTTFTFTLKAVVGTKTESRSYQVMPRAATLT